jgi:hypothetical protein
MRDHIAFDVWKERLREDCERQDKLAAFNAFSDYVLRLLWQAGIGPSVNEVSNAPERTPAD